MILSCKYSLCLPCLISDFRLLNVINKSDCSTGDKFVIKGSEGVRKQFLIINDVPILGFVNKGEKFHDCNNFNDITENVGCKVVDGLATVDLDPALPSPATPVGGGSLPTYNQSCMSEHLQLGPIYHHSPLPRCHPLIFPQSTTWSTTCPPAVH